MSTAKQYKIGDQGASGQKITTILGQSSLAVVYTTDDDHLRWEYFANDEIVPNWLLPSLTTFDSLMGKIKQVLPKQYKKDAFSELGKDLFAALNIIDEKDFYDTFKSLKHDILLKAIEPLRIRYIMSAVITTIVIIGILIPLAFIFKDYHQDAFICCTIPVFGSLGAVLSIMQRSTTLELDPLSSKKYVSLQGAIRAILGLLCGIFLLIVIKANLLLGTFASNNYVIAVFATIAGFSERFVPDLVNKFETSQKVSDTGGDNK